MRRERFPKTGRKLDRPVALKLLPARVANDPEWLRRFRAEARAASSLNHPHILVVHDFGEFRGRPFIVMEFVEGQTLRARIDASPLAVKEAVGITMQVASALAASHARGIVHRDIKPENVMLRPDGYVKVLDFGLARQLTGDEAETVTGAPPDALVGTLRYMSPEQSRGESALAPSDVFSLGLLLFEMIVGRHPFHAPSNIAVLHGIQSGTPPSSGAGAEIDDLLGEMLEKHARLIAAYNTVVSQQPIDIQTEIATVNFVGCSPAVPSIRRDPSVGHNELTPAKTSSAQGPRVPGSALSAPSVGIRTTR